MEAQRPLPTFSVVSGATVHSVVDGRHKEIMDLVEQTYRLHGDGRTTNPPSYFLRFPDRPRDRIIALPAALGGEEPVSGLKWISSFPGNLDSGIPRASAVLILNDAATGYPFACLESSIISAARTAASAAVAARSLSLSRRRPMRVGFIGVGLIARYVHEYLAATELEFAGIGVYDLERPYAEARAAQLRATHGDVTVHDTAEQLIRGSDVVVLATTAGEPYLHDPAWFAHHPLVLNVSLRDLDPAVILDSVNIVDDVEHVLQADTSVHLTEQRTGGRDFLHGTLRDVLTGRFDVPDDRTVVFSPFGLGVLDLALGYFVHRQAVERGLATDVPGFFHDTDRINPPRSDAPRLPAPAPLRPLALAPGARDRAALRSRSNPVPVDTAGRIFDAVRARAQDQPERVAFVEDEDTVAYGPLFERVLEIRASLADQGCSAGDVVACTGTRSSDTAALFIALEDLGAIYLPVDPAWPAARVADVMRRSSASFVVEYGRRAPGGQLSVRAHGPDGEPVVVPGRGEGDPRYVIFTSGSTGRPKGAVVDQTGLMNHLWAKVNDLGLTADDSVAFTAPLAFDISVWQMLAPLLVGGRVVVLPDDAMLFPRRIVRTLESREVTVAEVVPTLITALVQEAGRSKAPTPLPILRWLISTGEELVPSLAERVLTVLPHARLLNAYGPTECSDDVTHHMVTEADLGRNRLPVGQPVANATLYVLVHDAETGTWDAAEPGRAGELFVGGRPVGHGYVGDATATSGAFFRDTLDPTSPTGRLYRTGDLARIDEDGVHYLGRTDRQVKVGGVRIELGEIEAVLSRHARVESCAVSVFADTGRPELVAHYVAPEELPADDLQNHLSTTLPADMVPKRWVRLAALPLTGSGKVDHRSLPGRKDSVEAS
ncbi:MULTISPECIES: 2,3-diaminopropionate biosynthesis protein SbnB [unclassified Streptomyces]|uniref:2,3-diaminopropionate biosynthesis protein SbnB n=1 Tax=unclassified Streptomyces TaxID=2593676 RepID=UPI0027E47ED4|nr:2,3-diaminopropionate biosynthesis protein SbnB [Streptomyces sp. McG3]